MASLIPMPWILRCDNLPKFLGKSDSAMTKKLSMSKDEIVYVIHVFISFVNFAGYTAQGLVHIFWIEQIQNCPSQPPWDS